MAGWEKGWNNYLKTKRVITEDNTAWSGDPKQHPYADDFSGNAQQALGDLNNAFVAVQTMIGSSPGHPKNSKLKQIEQILKQAMKDLGDISGDVENTPGV